MRLKRFKEKIRLANKFFIKAPKKWHLPRKCDIVLYDNCGAENLIPYLTNYSFEILATEGEWLNVPCMLIALCRIYQFDGSLTQAYNDTFIRAAAPVVVMTFIDNNPEFYLLSNRHSDVKTIFIQNGLRADRSPLFATCKSNKDYHVDYMCVFGRAIGRLYGQYITGAILPIGSLKNNAIKVEAKLNKNSILFISQYRPCTDQNSPMFALKDGSSVSYGNFFAAERAVLKFLYKWCSANNKMLSVAGSCSEEDESAERAFYMENLPDGEWTYVPKTSIFSSYHLADASEIVVFIDSTLGYEAFARGKKVAAFSCRGFQIAGLAASFGWLTELPTTGLFWTKELDEIHFQRIMDYLNVTSDQDWDIARQRMYPEEIINFDPGNSQLVALLKTILVKH